MEGGGFGEVVDEGFGGYIELVRRGKGQHFKGTADICHV